MSFPRGSTLNPHPIHLNLNPATRTPILKVSTALQSVFLATNPNSPTPTFCHDRSVLRFSFAWGLRSHTRLNPRTDPRPPPPSALKVSTELQSVFLAMNPDSPTPTFCYDRSVLRFRFACGLRLHAKLNPRTPLTPAFVAHNPNQRGAVP